jgi:hypothetical protein
VIRLAQDQSDKSGDGIPSFVQIAEINEEVGHGERLANVLPELIVPLRFIAGGQALSGPPIPLSVGRVI